MLLVAFVDDGACRLESCPYLFAQLFCHRSHLAVFLMQFLQAVECVDDILFVGEFLCRLAQGGLCLEVFLEVVFACFGVEFQQVVVLLYIELV